ncbi:hypothetical protein [Microbacterium yannicii]|uniref:hypothetical protein n=1 Tax=Microbacterium yannicii TaxID=671622 RepID=UPI001889BEB9|nr:hypothetical protein [Microbacterium yannicii]MCO5953253.1 hypothetical protein [Microbacterium yannicii]
MSLTIQARTMVRLDDSGLRRLLYAQRGALFPAVFVQGGRWTEPGTKMVDGLNVSVNSAAPKDPSFYSGTMPVSAGDPAESVDLKWYVWDEAPDSVRDRIFRDVRAAIGRAEA